MFLINILLKWKIKIILKSELEFRKPVLKNSLILCNIGIKYRLMIIFKFKLDFLKKDIIEYSYME